MSEFRKRYLTEVQAAEYLSLSRSYLRKSRMKKDPLPGPRWRKLGRKIIYDVRDLDFFAESLPHQGGAT